MRRLATLSFLALAAASLAQFPGTTTPPPSDLKPGFDAITIGDAKDVLGFLAGPECEGRGTGQPGFQKAAEFVAARFKAAGLKPMGDDGTYFQNSTFYRVTPTDVEVTDADGKRLFGDGLALQTTADVDLTAPVVLVRTTDAKATLTDDQVASLKDKIVVLDLPAGRTAMSRQLFRAEPKATFTLGEAVGQSSPSVSQRAPSGARPMVLRGRIAKGVVVTLSPEMAAALAAPASETPTVTAQELPVHITAKTKTEEVKVPNVVGLLEGSDPTLKNEFIGIGGHLDHLGIQNGVVYPGADDDGSGSTAVLEIVKGMAANPKKPKRSILFMTFFGEEMGLLGSKFLTDHPPVPLDKMVAELQMDMVARDSYGAQNGDPNRMDKEEENRDTIRLVGSKRISTELDSIIQKANDSVGFKFKYDSEDVYTRSDHYNFAKNGIPIAFLFDGFTPDYHQPTDTVDKIDFLKLTNAAKLYYLTAYAIADRPEPLKKDVK